MRGKKELSKFERKRLERELRRNQHQRKENKRDRNKLHSQYPAYYILQRKRKAFIFDDKEESPISRVRGEAVRGVLA